MGKAKKKNIKRAKKELIKAYKNEGTSAEDELDMFLKIFQRLRNNK